MMQRIDNSEHKLRTPARLLKRSALLFCAVMIVFCGAFHADASDRVFDEYEVKAVFLYRLTLFITWPEESFGKRDQPFVIGILGEDPFGGHLDRVVKNETFKGKTILVRRYRSMEAVLSDPSQVLFFNPSLKHRWPHLRPHLESLPILTVSDMDDFGQLGGMVAIKTQINKIKIEINPDETRKAGLKISSKLLKVSRKVATDPKEGLR